MCQERSPRLMPAGYRGNAKSPMAGRVNAFLRRRGLKVEPIKAHRLADDDCPHLFRVLLPGGKQGYYHPDFYVSSRFWVEVKSGAGYNLDTLYRIAGAAKKKSNRYVVVCNQAFADAWKRWMNELPVCSNAHVRLLVFPKEKEELFRILRQRG